MSNQTETSIKTITNLRIYDATTPLAERIANARAAQENLAYISKSLEEDQKAVKNILTTLGLKESQLWEEEIDTKCIEEHHTLIAQYYCILLARTILRTTSPEFSDSIRSRFYSPVLLEMVHQSEVKADNVLALRSKFINLLEIHGPVKTQNFWSRLWDIIKLKFTSNAATA